MLSKEDSRRLAQLERQLRRDDPEFCALMEGSQPVTPVAKRIQLRLIVTAATTWLVVIILSALGWWIAAAGAALTATVILAATLVRTHRDHAT